MKFESSVTAVSWIPFEAVNGFLAVPFGMGLAHYDEPLPARLGDLDEWHRKDLFRECNELKGWIEVEDGKIAAWGQHGGGRIGVTRLRIGPKTLTVRAKAMPDIRPEPVVTETYVRFTQTCGGRTGVPAPRPVSRRPLFQIDSAVAWTTLSLTIYADGHSERELVGASCFPRHWIYDDAGELVTQTGLTDFSTWINDAFGDRAGPPAGRGLIMRQSMDGSIVQAMRLRKVYRGANEVEALRGIDIEVERGEMIAIVGPSGSGKTTLLNCLSGLDAFDGGKVIVDGQDLSAMSDRARTAYRRDHMGFVFQAFNLLPVLSAVENVEIPLLLQNVNSRESRRRALEMLEALGLAHRANHRPDQLSGGEQQRVAVARALVHKPAVVWADEPTGNLDTEVTQVIVELLVRMNKDGQTIVLVTHNPQVAERARRTLRMRDGRIEVASAERAVAVR